MTDKIEIQRELLNLIIKQTINRIKSLQKELENDKKLSKEFGMYEDCGEGYRIAVERTKARISELILQKITLEKWRKKLKYTNTLNP